MDFPQGIFWLLVAISNAYTYRIMVLGWKKKKKKKKKKEDEQFQLSTTSGLPH